MKKKKERRNGLFKCCVEKGRGEEGLVVKKMKSL